jgi:hypothetical protein
MKYTIEDLSHRGLRNTLSARIDKAHKKLADMIDPYTENRSYFPDGVDDAIAKAMGFKSALDLMNNWDEEVKARIDSLAGRHGYTIYKAMIAKRNGSV